MAKTRRKHRNRSPKGLGRNVELAVVEQGALITTKGLRLDPRKMQADRAATPIWAGRVYTGKPRGKTYPYAGAKRGGGDAPTS